MQINFRLQLLVKQKITAKLIQKAILLHIFQRWLFIFTLFYFTIYSLKTLQNRQLKKIFTRNQIHLIISYEKINNLVSITQFIIYHLPMKRLTARIITLLIILLITVCIQAAPKKSTAYKDKLNRKASKTKDSIQQNQRVDKNINRGMNKNKPDWQRNALIDPYYPKNFRPWSVPQLKSGQFFEIWKKQITKLSVGQLLKIFISWNGLVFLLKLYLVIGIVRLIISCFCMTVAGSVAILFGVSINANRRNLSTS